VTKNKFIYEMSKVEESLISLVRMPHSPSCFSYLCHGLDQYLNKKASYFLLSLYSDKKKK